ncbi:MAG: glycosyltransferase family 4 protein [Dysgonamonadaceae bacterium]|jgi:glycosyltransferase involved in cell wall biosynthesis|nr:glycosyltransferase family 4 protein [Dysgonamonadaceae bacterium]
MLNICFFIHNLSSHGGTERISIALANALSKQSDFRVSMLSLESFDTPFFSLNENVKTDSLNIYNANIRKNYFKAVRQLKKYLQENNIQVIIDVDVILSFISLAATAFTKVKVVSWEHYNYYLKRKSIIRKVARQLAARYSKAIVTLTERDIQFYKDKCKTKARIVSIPNFIEEFPSGFYFGSQKYILSIGHLEHRKGFDLLLDIWSKVDSKIKEGWKLLIIGEGEEKEKLEKQIQNNNMGDSVEILPLKANIEEYYKKTAIYAMSSRAEGLPMVLIEAKSLGIPTIAFDCNTGPQEIINNEIDGFLIPCFDTDAYAQCLTKLMQDRLLRRKLSQNALRDKDRFSSNQAVEKWRDLVLYLHKTDATNQVHRISNNPVFTASLEAKP